MDAVVIDNAVSGTGLLPIVNSYVVYFAPQAATLRSGESRILNQIAKEISQYQPTQVTVTSYADSVMAANPAQPLSNDRVDMVLTALNAFGMNIPQSGQITPNNADVVKQLSDIARRQAETVSKELSNRNISNKIVPSTSRGALDKSVLSGDDADADVTQMVVIDFRK